MRPTYLRLAAVAGLFLVAAVIGCGSSVTSSTEPLAAAAIERVVVGKPQRKSLVLSTTQPARIEPFEQAPLTAKLAGFVKHVHVDIGDRVEAGQTLVTIDIPELADDLAQKEALVAQAEAEIQQAAAHETGMHAATSTALARIGEAKAAVARATADDNRWQREYARIRDLADRGSVTEKLADEMLHQAQAAKAASDQAQAALLVAETAAQQAEAEAAAAEADRHAATARLRVAQAELARARTMAGYAEIKAPFGGTITHRAVDAGHFVQPTGGATTKPLLVVAKCDKLRAIVDVPEQFADYVDVGDQGTLVVQTSGVGSTTGDISRTSASLSLDSRSLRAEIDIANSEHHLRPGAYATCTLQLDRHDDVLVLPVAAVVYDGDATACRVVKEGVVESREIELGLRSGPEVEVIHGVDAGDDVVLLRAETLQSGQKVQVVAGTP